MNRFRTSTALWMLAATVVATAIWLEIQADGHADEAAIEAVIGGRDLVDAEPGERDPGVLGALATRAGEVTAGRGIRRLPPTSGAAEVTPSGVPRLAVDEQAAYFSSAGVRQAGGRISRASWTDDRAVPEQIIPAAENAQSLPAAPLVHRPRTVDDGYVYENDLPTPNISEPVSLHLNEVDVRQALEMLSRSHSINMLVGPTVTGSVTANLEGLDANTALNAIMKLCNLTSHRENGLIYIYSSTEYPQIDFQVKTLRLDYIAGTDVLPVISSLLSATGQAFANKIDPQDNAKSHEAITIIDMPRVIQRATEYVRQIDVPPLQVMIEAHVLQVNLTDDCRHGINYKEVMQAATDGGFAVDVVGFADPTSSPGVFAHFSSTNIDALLEFLKTTTDSKTLASPRVMVVNGQTAKIQVGEQIPYNVVTVTETTAVEEVRFLDVGVVLEVTPRISQDGRVMMRVKPKVSEGKFSPGSDLPGEETREIESDVLIRDGEGVVIGGLIQEKISDVQTKIPYLGDLHYIGRLFQKRQRVKQRTEVVITLIPRIQYPDGRCYERDIIDAERSQTPLLHQPLDPVYRPWELPLPDAIENPLTWQQIRAEFPPIYRAACQACASAPCECSGHGGWSQKPLRVGELLQPEIPALSPPQEAIRPVAPSESADYEVPDNFRYGAVGAIPPPTVLVAP